MQCASVVGQNGLDAMQAVQAKVGHDIVELFALRGWSLYYAAAHLDSMEDLRATISRGAAENAAPFRRYILLPRATPTNDADSVLRLMQLLAGVGRYPFYVDLYEDEENGAPVARAKAAYLLDSLMLVNEQLLLQVDVNAMLALGMNICREIAVMQSPCLAFNALEIYDKIRQVTQAFR